MKVNNLFKKYYKILNEQEPGDPAPDATPMESPPAEMAPPEETAPAEPEIKPIDNNEKLVIKILTNAFIFDKTHFNNDIAKRKYIDRMLIKILQSVNVPIAKIVEDVVSVINLDRNLSLDKIISSNTRFKESKTLRLINSYILMFEKPADATEPQAGDNNTQDIPANDKPTNSINSLSLSEIFPEYKELIVQALNHVPSPEEIITLRSVVREIGETDPEKIVITIQRLLNFSEDTLTDKETKSSGIEDDNGIEKYLANA